MAATPSAQTPRLRRKYKHPPITQVVCEFQFQGTGEWDWTIPGLIYQEIKAEFPQKRQENAFEVKIAPREGKIEQNLAGSLSKMQFLRGDGSAMVQIGPNLLAINVMEHYPGWETFEALIRDQLDIYVKVAQPIAYQRIGLRFINKLVFPTSHIETTEYLNYYPQLPPTVKQEHGTFAMRVFHMYDDEKDILNLQIGNTPLEGGRLAIALDLDYHLAKPDLVELGRGLSWVATAHDRIEEMFEACITDKTRSLFEETT